jgi:hypothetical protein
MTPAQPLALTLAAALAVAQPALGDEVTDQLDAARTAYQSGELHTAVDSLNFAVAKIKEQVTARLLQLLPEPLLKHSPDSSDYEASLMVGNRILIQGKGSGLTDEKAVQQYLEALDLDAIQKALGG